MKTPLVRRLSLAKLRTHRKAQRLPVAWQGMLWMAMGGLMFSLLNTIARAIALEMDAFQTQFLRYLCGLVVMLPLVWRAGLAAVSYTHLRAHETG
jgi:hypothetical protein